MAALIDNRIEWKRRAAAALRGHVTARLEVALPTVEVEIAKGALQKDGWQALSVVQDESDDRRVLVVGTKQLRSTVVGQNPSRIAREVAERLGEARVLRFYSLAVMTGRPELGSMERWVPAATDGTRRAKGGLYEATPCTEEAAPVGGVALLGAEAEARRAWERLRAGSSGHDLTPERERTAGQRLLERPPRRASSPGEPRRWPLGVGLGALLFVVAWILAMMAAGSSGVDESSLTPPLWQLPLLRTLLLASGGASSLLALAAWVGRQRQARLSYPTDHDGDLRAFERRARTPITGTPQVTVSPRSGELPTRRALSPAQLPLGFSSAP